MSSILGIANFDKQPISEELVASLLLELNTGVSDYTNIWIKDNVGLACSSFYTTPESQFEQQPLTYMDESLSLVADARIDNREELISKLSITCAPDSGRIITDAEIILHAYCKWSDQCVHHLLGDFSFAVFDKNKQHFFIARDHLGLRPLYYFRTKNTFAFCSEIQPLLNTGIVSPEIDMEAFEISLLFDAIPGGSTYFKHISRFTGGTTTSIDVQGARTLTYWRPEEYEIQNSISVQDAVDEFLEIFETAVSARLRSAYAVGFELSGGLDSSSVVAMADKIGVGQNWYTLALRFGDLDCDEGQYINAVSKCIKREPLELDVDQLDFTSTHKLKDFYAQNPDWPADLFFLPHNILAEMASEKGVRVLLTGHGGDEVMQGSRWVSYDYLKDFSLFNLAGEIARSRHKKHDLMNYLVRPLLPGTLINSLRFIKDGFRSKSLVTALQKKRIMYRKMQFDNKPYKLRSSWDTARMLGNLEAALWRDSNPYHLNAKNRIEVRHPFLDIRLIRFRLTSPASLFYRHGQYKVLLRKAMRRLLPDKVLARQGKAVFGEIIDRQLKSEKFDDLKMQAKLKKLLPDLNWNHLSNLHAKRDFDDHKQFLEWKLLNMYFWLLNIEKS